MIICGYNDVILSFCCLFGNSRMSKMRLISAALFSTLICTGKRKNYQSLGSLVKRIKV